MAKATQASDSSFFHYWKLTEFELGDESPRRFEWRLPSGLVVISSTATGNTESGPARDCEGTLYWLEAEEMRNEIAGSTTVWVAWRVKSFGDCEEPKDAKSRAKLERQIQEFVQRTNLVLGCGNKLVPCGAGKYEQCITDHLGHTTCQCLPRMFPPST